MTDIRKVAATSEAGSHLLKMKASYSQLFVKVWVWVGQREKKVHLKADRAIVVGVKCLKQEVSIHTRIWKKEIKFNPFEYDDEVGPSNREMCV